MIAESLTFQDETDRASSATVSFEQGATITASGADGTTFQLVIPRFAVEEETVVTMTPLVNVAGVGNAPAHAVRLEPEGLTFWDWPRLTITPAEPIEVEDQVMFQATGEGEGVHAALIDAHTEEIVLLLPHFSIAGAGAAEAAGTWQAYRSIAILQQIAHEIALVLKEIRERELREGPSDGDPGIVDRVMPLYDRAEAEVMGPMRDAARISCEATKLYVQALIELERQRQLIGLSSQETENATAAEITRSRDASFSNCERLKISECRAKQDPGILVAFWISWERQRQLLGEGELEGIFEGLAERAIKICLAKDYRVDKTVTGSLGGGFSWTVRYTGIKCGGHEGNWEVDTDGTLTGGGDTAQITGPITFTLAENTLAGPMNGMAIFTDSDPGAVTETRGEFSGTATLNEDAQEVVLNVTAGGGDGYQFGFLDTGITGPGTLTLPFEEGEFCLEPPE